MRQSAETQWPPIFNHPGNSEFENGSKDIRCPFTFFFCFFVFFLIHYDQLYRAVASGPAGLVLAGPVFENTRYCAYYAVTRKRLPFSMALV